MVANAAAVIVLLAWAASVAVTLRRIASLSKGN